LGTYKTEFSNVGCKVCENMPPTADGYYNTNGSTTPMCPYICNANLRNVLNNPKCLSSFEIFVDNIGGYPIISILGIATLLALVVISYFFYARTKSSSKESDDIEVDENLNKLRLAAMELDFV
jgi:hypothetical protein